MQAISNTKILGKTPTIILTHKLLQSIKHLVTIAPQEAQWFHTISQNAENNSFTLDGIYIPEQVCSAAEVDSSSTMMVDFYKELAKAHGPVGASDLLANMGVWCHSHHNMNVSPSGQDINQFTTMINNAIEQNNLKPQIMLIFNKKNQYYNRLWDPLTDTIWENIPLTLQGYDFTDLSNQAVSKFKKKTFSKASYSGWNKPNKKKKGKSSKTPPYLSSTQKSVLSQPYNPINTTNFFFEDTEFYNEFEEMFCEIYAANKKYINTTETNLAKVLNWYMNTLHITELLSLCFYFSKDYARLQAVLSGELKDIPTQEVVEILTEALLSKNKILIKDVTTFLSETSGIHLSEISPFIERCAQGEF